MCQLRKVTKISKQKRSSKRYNVFLDESYAFSVGEDIYIKYHLHKGKMLSESDITQIKSADDFQRSYLLAIHYLSFRVRTEKEMRLYLKQKEIGAEAINKIINQLVKERLLDDLEFANMFVRDRMNRSTKGPKVIAMELKEMGIITSKIDEALEQFTKEVQIARARVWAEKELNKKSKHSFFNRKEQLRAKLLQRGYARDVVSELFSTLQMKRDETEEMQILKVQADKLYSKYSRKYDGNELQQRLKQQLYRRGFDLDAIQSYLATLDY